MILFARFFIAACVLSPPTELQRDRLLEYRDATGEIRPVESLEHWGRRRAAIVAAMQTVMGRLPRSDRTAPAVRVLEEVDCGSYVRRLITIRTQPECETPAYLCVPKIALEGSHEKLPAVLCLHPTDNTVGHKVVVGLGGKPNRQYASELAERGYVTIAPAYPLLANYQPDLKTLGWKSGTLKAVADNMRAIDYLQSLDYVRADAIGAIGHSLGGHNSVYTAVFDTRIKVVVSSCGLDRYRDYYGGDQERWKKGKGWTSERYMPRLADFRGRLDEIPFDFPEMIAALAPRHVLIVAPLHDSNFRASSVDKIAQTVRPVFDLHRSPDHFQVLHPDCGHDFPAEMREHAYTLLDRVIGND